MNHLVAVREFEQDSYSGVTPTIYMREEDIEDIQNSDRLAGYSDNQKIAIKVMLALLITGILVTATAFCIKGNIDLFTKTSTFSSILAKWTVVGTSIGLIAATLFSLDTGRKMLANKGGSKSISDYLINTIMFSLAVVGGCTALFLLVGLGRGINFSVT